MDLFKNTLRKSTKNLKEVAKFFNEIYGMRGGYKRLRNKQTGEAIGGAYLPGLKAGRKRGGKKARISETEFLALDRDKMLKRLWTGSPVQAFWKDYTAGVKKYYIDPLKATFKVPQVIGGKAHQQKKRSYTGFLQKGVSKVLDYQKITSGIGRAGKKTFRRASSIRDRMEKSKVSLFTGKNAAFKVGYKDVSRKEIARRAERRFHSKKTDPWMTDSQDRAARRKQRRFKTVASVGRGVGTVTGRKPLKDLKKTAKAFGKIAKGGAKLALMGGLAGLLATLADAINPFKPLIAALSTIFTIFGTILSQAFMPLIQTLFDVMLSPQALGLFEMLAVLMAAIIEPLLPIVEALFPALFSILEVVVGVLMILVPILDLFLLPLQMLIPLFGLLEIVMTLLSVPLQILGKIMMVLVGIVMDFAKVLWDYFGGIIDFLIGWINGIKLIFTGGFDSVADGFKYFINLLIGFVNQSLIGSINSVIGLINKIPGVNLGRIPSIPLMAEGGIITRPTLVMAGERGREAIIPLDQYNGGDGGRSEQIVINVYIENVADDSMIEKITRRITEELERQKYWTG
jgi:hypothetical protein